MSLKNSLISVSVATVLIGCGGSGNSSTENKITAKNYVCEDLNLNSKCDLNENKKEVESWETYSKVSQKSLKAFDTSASPLLYEGSDNLKLVATNNSNKISPLTTLIFNEIINNENVSNEDEALTYLKTQFSFTDDLNESQKKNFLSRLTKLSNEEGFSYENLNRFVSQSVKEKKFDVKHISFKSENKLQKKWLATKSEESLTWEQSDHDENAVASSIRGNTAVVATKYHNSLVLVNVNENTISHNQFSRIDGDRFHVDAVTGASEHTMSDVELSVNEKDIYVLVEPANSELGPKDKTWGLFKTQIVDNKINNFDDVNTIRYSESKKISDITLSKDSTVLAAYESEYNTVIFFDKDLNELNKDIELNDTFIDMSISNDNKYLFVSSKKDDIYKLTKYEIDSKSKIKEISLDYEASLKNNYDTDELVIFKKEDNKSIFILSQDTLEITKEVNLDVVLKTVTVFKDKLFLTNNTINEVLAYDLSLSKPKVEFTATSSALVQTVFANSSKVFLPLHEKGEIEVINYTLAGFAKNKMKNDLEKLTYETINHGMPLEVTMFDLQLNKSALRGSGSTIEWAVSDSLKDYVVTKGINIGKITRPENSSANVSGKLTATVKKEFRGELLTDSKTFDLTIKKKPVYLEAKGQETLGSLDGGGYVFFLATNGSKVAVQLYGKNSNGNGFKIFTINNNQNKLDKTVHGKAIDSTGLVNEDNSKNIYFSGQLYDGIHASSEGAGIVMKDEKTLFVLKGTKKIKLDESGNPVKDSKGRDIKEIRDNGALMTYVIDDVSIASNDNKAKKVGDTILFPGEQTEALSSAYIGNKLVVLIEGTFEGEKSKKALIYDISNLEKPVLQAKVDNIAGNKVALNDDASIIYTLNGSMVEKYDVINNSKVGEVESKVAFSISAKDNNVFIGDKEGNLSIYDKDLEFVNKYISGYGRYGGRTSGEGHAFGRVEDIQVMNNKIYLGNKYRGLIVLDAQDLKNLKELKVYEHENYRRGIVSEDGSVAIPFYYYERARNDISYIKINN